MTQNKKLSLRKRIEKLKSDVNNSYGNIAPADRWEANAIEIIQFLVERLEKAEDGLKRLSSSEAFLHPFMDGKSPAWKELVCRTEFAEQTLKSISLEEKE